MKDESEEGGDGTFPDFDEFVDGLDSWKDSLKPAWDTKKFRELFKFVKSEYKSKQVKYIFENIEYGL